jgi:S-formylglutathione hydrolase
MKGSWSRLDVAGKPAEVYEPPGQPRFGVLFLHGLDNVTLRDDPIFTPLLAEGLLACVCPSGGPSWWTDRPCPDFDASLTAEAYLLQHVVPYFRSRWGLEPRSLGLLGVSMGGQAVLKLAFRHPQVLAVVAALSPTLDYHELYGQGTPLDVMYDSKEQCRQDTAPLHVQPGHTPAHLFYCIDPDDPWLPGSDRLRDKLIALGAPHEADLTTRAGGHSWDYFYRQAGRAVEFIRQGLEQQSRRLL